MQQDTFNEYLMGIHGIITGCYGRIKNSMIRINKKFFD